MNVGRGRGGREQGRGGHEGYMAGTMDSAAGLHQTRIPRPNDSYLICDNCGLATQWVSQDGWPFDAALIKNNDAAKPK